MTVEEKRERIHNFCDNQACDDCILKNQGWSHGCLDIDDSPETDLDRALAMIDIKTYNDRNPYWKRITEIAARQRSKGIKEYGQGVEADTAKIDVRLDRIEEELIDALMYLEHLRDAIKQIKELIE